MSAEAREARQILREHLAKYPTITTLTASRGKRGVNGHRVDLVRVLLVRDWDGKPEPIDATDLTAKALRGLYPVKERGGVEGLAVQTGGGPKPQEAVYLALVDALEVEESGADRAAGVRHLSL